MISDYVGVAIDMMATAPLQSQQQAAGLQLRPKWQSPVALAAESGKHANSLQVATGAIIHSPAEPLGNGTRCPCRRRSTIPVLPASGADPVQTDALHAAESTLNTPSPVGRS